MGVRAAAAGPVRALWEGSSRCSSAYPGQAAPAATQGLPCCGPSGVLTSVLVPVESRVGGPHAALPGRFLARGLMQVGETGRGAAGPGVVPRRLCRAVGPPPHMPLGGDRWDSTSKPGTPARARRLRRRGAALRGCLGRRTHAGVGAFAARHRVPHAGCARWRSRWRRRRRRCRRRPRWWARRSTTWRRPSSCCRRSGRSTGRTQRPPRCSKRCALLLFSVLRCVAGVRAARNGQARPTITRDQTAWHLCCAACTARPVQRPPGLLRLSLLHTRAHTVCRWTASRRL